VLEKVSLRGDGTDRSAEQPPLDDLIDAPGEFLPKT
jgi:hypothetical protein